MRLRRQGDTVLCWPGGSPKVLAFLETTYECEGVRLPRRMRLKWISKLGPWGVSKRVTGAVLG